MAGEEKQYSLSTTRIHWNGDSRTETILILAKEVNSHLKTGNWHIGSSTNLNSLLAEPIAIQILENAPLQIKFEKYQESGILRGEDQYSKLFKKL